MEDRQTQKNTRAAQYTTIPSHSTALLLATERDNAARGAGPHQGHKSITMWHAAEGYFVITGNLYTECLTFELPKEAQY
jgi:hypothetical protein